MFRYWRPSTEELTDLVRKKKQQFLDHFTKQEKESPFVEEIASQLDSYFAPEVCNFEELFHVLETMSSYFRGRQQHIGRKYKPPFGAFIKLNCDKWLADKGREEYLLSLGKLIIAKQHIREVVAARIFEYMESFDSNHKHRWFANFWNDVLDKCAWDIATLNYDYSIEKVLVTKLLKMDMKLMGKVYTGLILKNLYYQTIPRFSIFMVVYYMAMLTIKTQINIYLKMHSRISINLILMRMQKDMAW